MQATHRLLMLVYNNNSPVRPDQVFFGGTAGTIGFGFASLQVTAVPEPTSMAMIFLSLICFVRNRYRTLR